MRTETTTRILYKFEELSDAAKETARGWWRDCEHQDNSFSESVYENAATVAEMFGLDIRTRPVNLTNNSTHYDPCIYYSGFSSQGDGACFEGNYAYKKGALKAVKEYAPRDTVLHNIVQSLQDLQKRNFYQVSCSMVHRGHYYHSGCMQVGCSRQDDRDIIGEDDFIQTMREFADWIYARLESEYEWIMSDEQIDDAITTNEYEFTEDGDIA